MANRSSSNVVPFAANFVPPADSLSLDSAQLLALCRDRLAHGVATAFAEKMGAAGEDLLGMADRATSLQQQQLYLTTLEFLRERGQTLLQHFRAAYVQRFDDGVAAIRVGRRRERADDLGELRLVDTDDFERDLAIGKLSARAACSCANQLTALDHRFAALLHVQRISQDDNPLHPRALFAAMLRAVDDLGGGEQLALALLHELERQTAGALPGIYTDLNRSLSDCGVLPKIPVDLGRAPAAPPEPGVVSGPGRDSEWPAGAQPGFEPGAPAGSQSGGPAAQPAADIFAQLARAIQSAANALPQAPAHPAPRAPQSQPAAHPGPDSWGALGSAQLIEALTRLQQGRPEAWSQPRLGPVQIDPTAGQVLQQLRSTPLAGSTTPVDALTLDIVAMLFDVVFNDPELPAAVRAEIARLQIPVLKVALLDKTFFSNKAHPARRLMDLIANAGIGLNESETPRLQERVRSAVDAVVAGFETDIDIFAAQARKLEDFLREEEARAQDRTSEAVTRLEQQERQQRAKGFVASEIESRIQRRSVPTLVADFLSRHWRLVLVRAYLHSGEGGATFTAALRAMDDLLWSVEPKGDSEERNRLLGALPDLLARLRTGLDALGLGDAWDPFFAQLIRLHMEALHREGGGEPPSVDRRARISSVEDPPRYNRRRTDRHPEAQVPVDQIRSEQAPSVAASAAPVEPPRPEPVPAPGPGRARGPQTAAARPR